MNLFKKKVIKNNAANLKVLENRIKVLSDSLEAESESVDIYKNEYEKLLKKYEELIYKHNYTISSLKLLKAIINQNSNYTDEQLAFNSVQKYSKYLETMINIVIDYSCTEKENKSDSFEEKSQALSESQYNEIASICTENAKLQSNEKEYKCKIDVLVKALTDTRQYLKCIETGEDFVSINPPSDQVTLIDAALKEAKSLI